jgi:hypothetical protein
VNAAAGEDRDTDRRQAGPTVSKMIEAAIDSAIKQSTRDTIRLAGSLFDDLRRRYPKTAFHGPVVIDIASVRDPARRRCFRLIKTALDIPPAQVDALRRLGAAQLEAAPAYRAFLKTLRGRRTGGPRSPQTTGACSAPRR